jgi:hypothetical protein
MMNYLKDVLHGVVAGLVGDVQQLHNLGVGLEVAQQPLVLLVVRRRPCGMEIRAKGST